jgi:ATP-dependent DNA helicase RecQ
VPALVLPGLTIVVSPLISLMQDQVAALRRRSVAAAYLSSSQKPEVLRATWDVVTAGKAKLLYVAPERLEQLPARLSHLEISLLAVDEAHCISEWGHDFRPAYRAIGALRRTLGDPPTVAVTGTATPATRDDMVRVLGLRRPVRVTGSFDRPNLRFEVRKSADERERFAAVHGLLLGSGIGGMGGRGGQDRAGGTGSAVVYVPTRNRADGVARALRWGGVNAAPYHAALPAGARRALLTRFLDGRIPVIVATNAFGMGIDKPDVRLVAHLGVPPRPEAYYQEAGRAGRDGKPALCPLFWCERDFALARALGQPGGGRRGTESAETRARRHGLDTMHRYVTTRGCRRQVLLEYLGESGVRCAGCDRCG